MLGHPAVLLNCLGCILRSAARPIGRVPTFDHTSTDMRDVLHLLLRGQRTEFRVAVLVWYSLIGQAPAYLIDFSYPPLIYQLPPLR